MKRITKDQLMDYIEEVIEKEPYGIGIHGVSKSKNGYSKQEILEKMIDEGIDINEGNSILATVSSLGISKNLSGYQKNIISTYHYGKEEGQYNLVVAVPKEIRTKGKSIYLGFPDPNTDTAGNQYKTTCVLDYLCCHDEKRGHIPKEFILGYYIADENQNENNNIIFQKNDRHYSNLSDDEREQFVNDLDKRLEGRYREISDAALSKDIATLERLEQEDKNNLRQMFLQKRSELLKQGIVNEELVKSNVESYANLASKQAKNEIIEEQRQTTYIKTDSSKQRRIPIGLLQNGDSSNKFIQECRQKTNTEEEIISSDIKSLTSPTIKEKDKSKDIAMQL